MPQKLISQLTHLVPPALHYPAYRAYWLGLLASVSGFQMLRFGQYWLVYQLTGSPLALGYVGLASGVSAIGLNLFGGVVADRFDQGRLIMTTQSLTAGLIFVLATLTFLDTVQVWHVVLIAFGVGGVEAFDGPARQADLGRRQPQQQSAVQKARWSLSEIDRMLVEANRVLATLTREKAAGRVARGPRRNVRRLSAPRRRRE